MFSVHHPSVAEVSGEIPSVLPVAPPLHPGAHMGLPQRVFDDTHVVAATVRLAVIQRHAHAVRLGAVAQARVDFFLGDVGFQVPHVGHVGS